MQSDLAWLRSMVWEEAIRRHLRYGGKLIGICGGLQMLGQQLHDPLGMEGEPGSVPGLGLFNYETTLGAEKTLENVSGTLLLPGVWENAPRITGYRFQMGVTRGVAPEHPATLLDGAPEGAHSKDGQIMASYCHGLFNAPQGLEGLLEWAGHKPGQHFDPDESRQRDLDRLADAVEESLDLERLADWLPLKANI